LKIYKNAYYSSVNNDQRRKKWLIPERAVAVGKRLFEAWGISAMLRKKKSLPIRKRTKNLNRSLAKNAKENA
jgi:hypothetical protein